MSAPSFWLSAAPEHFTARCYREWAERMRYDRKFGQAAPERWGTLSTEECRLEAEDYHRRERARRDAA